MKTKNSVEQSLKASGAAVASFFAIINLYWIQSYHGMGYIQDGFFLFMFFVLLVFFVVTLVPAIVLSTCFNLEPVKFYVATAIWGGVAALILGQGFAEMAA